MKYHISKSIKLTLDTYRNSDKASEEIFLWIFINNTVSRKHKIHVIYVLVINDTHFNSVLSILLENKIYKSIQVNTLY